MCFWGNVAAGLTIISYLVILVIVLMLYDDYNVNFNADKYCLLIK